ncbi:MULTISPECIES: sulfite exporter TauE/SafE family protein [Staphylococcus]|uniref:sulfite exporter TauE/SafE family protein n=1 Tax=Staphylococcus TaxID=1279 RepID=UPI00374E05BD
MWNYSYYSIDYNKINILQHWLVNWSWWRYNYCTKACFYTCKFRHTYRYYNTNNHWHFLFNTGFYWFIFTSSLASSIGHTIQEHVFWDYSVVLIIASYIGTKFGVRINRNIDSAKLSNLLKFVLILMSIYLIFKELNEL